MKKENLFRILVVCIFGLIVLAASIIFVQYWPTSTEIVTSPAPTPFSKREKLVVITRNDLQGYYSYQNEPQGFEYDLAKAFSHYAGLELQMVTGSNWSEIQNALYNNHADIVTGMVANAPGGERFSFSKSYITARQVPIFNKKQAPVNSVSDLSGRTISVAMSSVHQTRLDTLMADGLVFNAVYYQDKTTDDFVKGVAEGLYDVTMAYDYIAMAYTRHYPNISVGVVLKDDLELAWAVRPEDTELLAKINEFLFEMETTDNVCSIKTT